MIINIRGTNGSGKSHLIRSLMANYPSVVPIGSAKKADGYLCTGNILPSMRVVGAYTPSGGGCDGISIQEEICNRVREYSKISDVVLFEGILISRTFERYLNLSKELLPNHTIFAFLDTPLDVCIERVKARRIAKGNEKPLNLRSLTDTWTRHKPLYKKYLAHKLDARWVPYQTAADDIWGWICPIS
jgi:uridine kinase